MKSSPSFGVGFSISRTLRTSPKPYFERTAAFNFFLAYIRRLPKMHLSRYSHMGGAILPVARCLPPESRNTAVSQLPQKAGLPPGRSLSYTAVRPWHFLNFLPLPHGHGSLRPTFPSVLRTGFCVVDSSRLVCSRSKRRAAF